MPRYIDAEELKATVKANDWSNPCVPIVVNMIIDRSPSSDVVEVVRCSDCDVPHNSWTGCPNLNGMIPPPDFYCARGERKQQTDGATDANVGGKSEWISVDERLPERAGAYLTYTFRGYTKLSHFEKWAIGEEPSFDDYTVTHWMPLPEPPKGENNDS